MNQTLPIPSDNTKIPNLPDVPFSEIVSIVDASNNILSSISNIISSNNEKDVAITSMKLKSKIEKKKIKVAYEMYLDKRVDNSKKFDAILNSSFSEDVKKELLTQLIEESKSIWCHL